MHQTRQEVDWKIPITRKGTKYIVRPASHVKDSIPVLIAIRDVLKLARTSREVRQMIHQKMLKLNGRQVTEMNDSIKLFNILEADKKYSLVLLPTGRYSFKETKANERLCKIMSRTLVSKNKIQLNLHDGTNIIGNKDLKVGDSVYISLDNKLKSHVKFEKGKSCFIISGKYRGHQGKIDSVSEDGLAKISLTDGGKTEIPSKSVIVQ
jgi:small subunit ribosomal protein S4e